MHAIWLMLTLLAPTTAPADDEGVVRPGEVRRGMHLDEPREQRYARYYQRLAREVEPDRVGDPKRIEQYLRHFTGEIIHDQRLIVFDVQAQVRDGQILLTGYAEYPEQVESLKTFLGTLGFDPIASSVVMVPVLPRPLGIVSADRAFIYSAATEPREALNEVMLGEPMYLLASENGHYLCHGPDGYVGWIDASAVNQVDPGAFATALTRPARDEAKLDAVLASARSRLGLPYVWGGRSDAGMDCSGLVQSAFESQGILLPRDAEQQASVGRLVATRWHRNSLRKGDLLFFLGRRGIIAHTAIYLGNDEFIEASGTVKITSFNPSASNYAKQRDEMFCFAKRVIE